MKTELDCAAEFLSAERWTQVSVDGEAALMKVLPALEVLKAEREAKVLSAQCEDKTQAGVFLTAALLSRCVYKNGERMFSCAEQVLKDVSIKGLAELSAEMKKLNSRANPSPQSPGEKIRELRRELGEDAYQRLRWRVLRTMGALPGEQRVKDMTDGDYMYCILNMWLDREEELNCLCPDCRRKAKRRVCRCCGAELDGMESDVNESFDEEKFRELMDK